MRLHTRLVSGNHGDRVPGRHRPARRTPRRSPLAEGRPAEPASPTSTACRNSKPTASLLTISVSTTGGKARLEELFRGWGVPLDQMERTDKGAPLLRREADAGTRRIGPGVRRPSRRRHRRARQPGSGSRRRAHGLRHPGQEHRRRTSTPDDSTPARRPAGSPSRTPGLTVLGKRDGKHAEREVLIAEEGHVIRAFDMSQIDARAVAALSQCPDYIERFTRGVICTRRSPRRSDLEDREPPNRSRTASRTAWVSTAW